MADQENGKASDNEEPENKERVPQFVPSRPGRIVTLGWLVERIIEEFNDEHGDDSPALLEATDDTKRRMLVRDVAEYIFGVESVQLAHSEQADIIQRAYAELFGFGPLDKLLRDERVTTISLEGVEKASVRFAPGDDFTTLEPLFEDIHHLRQTIRRLLMAAGAELRDDIPVIETGLQVSQRRVCVNVALPPFTTEISVDMRVHPAQPITLDDLVRANYLPAKAAEFLRALAQSEHGFIIVGDTVSGKTTLLGALAQYLPLSEKMAAVERAGELWLPEVIQRFAVRWQVGAASGLSFGEQVTTALAMHPDCILLDEVRADEPQSIAPLLAETDAKLPRQIWSFRGASDTKRTRTALSMVARMSDPTQAEAQVRRLYERLPFMVVVKRRRGRIELREIAEWQWRAGSDYPDYVELFTPGMESVEMTGKRPFLPVQLPEGFWN